MKCNNCKIKIDSRFKAAIKHNKCPACDEQIMGAERLAAYMSLQSLIKQSFSDIDAEKIANIVVANFELKQLFNKDSDDDVSYDENFEVLEDEVSDIVKSDEAHKAKQIAEAKSKLKELKEHAYEEALRHQYGMTTDDDEDVPGGGLFESDLKPEEITTRMNVDQKISESQGNMLSGTGGFTRSDG